MKTTHVGPLATMIAAGALLLGAATPSIAAGDEVKAIYAGTFHACATKTDRTAWCWGDNEFHQIGDGTTDDRPTPVQVERSGGGFLGGITRISAGSSSHTCGGKPDGTVRCWGANTSGELGDGTTRPAALPRHSHRACHRHADQRRKGTDGRRQPRMCPQDQRHRLVLGVQRKRPPGRRDHR